MGSDYNKCKFSPGFDYLNSRLSHKNNLNEIFRIEKDRGFAAKHKQDIEREKFSYIFLRRSYQNACSLNDRAVFDNCFNLHNSIPISKLDPSVENINNSFIIRLSRFLIKCIGSNFFLLENNRLGDEFYNYCRDLLKDSDISKEVEDPDLLIIYLRQLVVILKHSDFLLNNKGIAKVITRVPSCHSMFLILFSSFWNRVRWEEIFPSMPDAAKELKRNRSIIINLLINQPDSFRIDEISNEFFRLSGFGKINDIYLISFLDFYFFTWLKFFGVIKYLDGSINDPVYVELTSFGRIVLRCI